MYLWNVKQLKKDLSKSPLLEKEQFKYLIVTITLFILGGIIPVAEKNTWDIYVSIITGIITILGSIYVYKCNNGEHGKYFLQRFISLQLVWAIRFFILIVLPVLLISMPIPALFKHFNIIETFVPEQWFLFYAIVVHVLNIIYFWFLGEHMKDIANKKVDL